MNIKFSIIITTSLIIALNISATSLNNDIQVKSDTVEFLKHTNQISFINNVEINSNFVKIKANSAIYDDVKDTLSILGTPSVIKSINKNNIFDGKAEEIMFFSDEKIHLIGNASMIYENISISSNIIIFNPMTGKISSE